jgi:hypothetical protein
MKHYLLFFFCLTAVNWSANAQNNENPGDHKITLNDIDSSRRHLIKANFEGNVFTGDAYFKQTVFSDTTNFASTTFFCADFGADTFNNPVSFNSAVFKGRVNFSSACFKDDADFTAATFDSVVSFMSARFSHIAHFENLHFAGKNTLDFTKTHLPDTLDFSDNAALENEINLLAAQFDSANSKRIYVEFSGPGMISDISRFHMDYMHFKLYFDSSTTDEQKNLVYQKLLKNFRDRGQEESYEILDIEYSTYKIERRLGMFSFLSAVPYHWNHFGYSKGMVFCWTASFLLLFSFLTYFQIHRLNGFDDENGKNAETATYRINSIPQIGRNRKVCKNDPYYLRKRIWYSFVYTSEVFFHIVIKMENLEFSTSWWRALYILMIYSAGILCLAYMANFIFH